MTADPLAYLRAAHAEAEAEAEAAGGDQWAVQEHESDTVAVYDSRREPVVYDEGAPTPIQKTHIAKHSPAAVLRRIAADRKLIAKHAEIDFPYNPDDGPGDYSWTARCDGCYEDAPCTTLRLIAEGWGWTEETT